jgi:hypothetical protein
LQLGATQFIENMDRTTLTITDEEFETNVEAAVSAIAEKHRLESPQVAQDSRFDTGEKPRSPLPPPPDSSRPPTNDGDSSADEKAPMAGLFRSIQRPLSSIGRIFSEELSNTIGGGSSSSSQQQPSQSAPGGGVSLLPSATTSLRSPRSATFAPSALAPPPPPPPHRDPSPDARVGRPQRITPPWELAHAPQPLPQHPQHRRLSAQDAAARQASAEVAEAQRLHRAEHSTIVDTLAGMFPDLDRDIISDVVYQKQGRVGLAVDACLLLSS